jgi:hypothetical protein
MTIRRLKTFSAQTGYVYQYYFVGKREALPGDPAAPATEYVFDVTVDGSVVFAVSVLMRAAALASWAAVHSRLLTESEQYAAAKLRLLRDFEAMESPARGARRLVVDAEDVEDLLADLGLDERSP